MRKVILFLSFVLIGSLLISFISVPVQAAIPAEERSALIALYNAANGDSWYHSSGWKTPPLHTDGFAMPGTEDAWYGITVSGGHVTVISMDSNRLNGSIPPELGNLGNLEELWLSANQLSGSIPPELGNLSNLLDLFLYDNQLSGSIPPELGNLGNLEELSMPFNQLSGSMPPELGNLGNLMHLDLSSNQLSGSIPAELGDLNNLGAIRLNFNHLSGGIPPELGNLGNLVGLNLEANRLSGNIPSSLTNLTNLIWAAIGYNSLYTHDDTLRTFLIGKNPDWEDTQTLTPVNISAAGMSTSLIRISWNLITYTGDTGGYKVYYSTTPGGSWTYAGMTADKSVSYYDVAGLYSGTKYYFVVKTQTDPHFSNDNTVVSEYSEEISAEPGSRVEKDPPFGSFDTPIDDSTAAGSVPITGWALDDVWIDSIKIYREQGDSLVYIGDAILVEGARPDVAASFPTYPNNTKAGWGYMMLTNFLPGGGNGTFVLHAIATDLAGKTTTLGAKTIICDNANAVKPFGAIDTPGQGGAASGGKFVNWGWVLTPRPNSIPTDGSTINVWVDGVNLGRPTYDIYRSDIAALFPGYANSYGAIGYFYLDTAAYANGVHTIQWTAKDDAGNSDGIGSRYFSINNSGAGSSSSSQLRSRSSSSIQFNMDGIRIVAMDNRHISQLPEDYSVPVSVKRGYNEDSPVREIQPDEKGINRIVINQLERIEVHFHLPGSSANDGLYAGYMKAGNGLTELPIGSTLDAGKGIFYWQPGPGFLGRYRLVFVETAANGEMIKKNIIVEIVPKSAKTDPYRR
jgi:Leucine-rich repeat (LRR) protein